MDPNAYSLTTVETRKQYFRVHQHIISTTVIFSRCNTIRAPSVAEAKSTVVMSQAIPLWSQMGTRQSSCTPCRQGVHAYILQTMQTSVFASQSNPNQRPTWLSKFLPPPPHTPTPSPSPFQKYIWHEQYKPTATCDIHQMTKHHRLITGSIV